MLKTKYLLPLIIILILSFTLIGDCSWVFNVKEEINTATYDNFGISIKTGSDTIIYFVREATAHAGVKGKIVRQAYTISTKTWAARADVYDDANADYDSRNLGGGIIGTNIYLFFGRYNISTSAFIDVGYMKSTDLTGTSWGSYTIIATGADTFSYPHGHLASCATSGKYLQPFYMLHGATYSVKFFTTTDSGDNWAIGDTIYSGATGYSETCVAYIGDNEMIALLRNNAGGYVAQSVSTDNGANWSAPTNTNLGESTGVKVPHILYDSSTNKVIALYQDRCATSHALKISVADADTVHNSATSWGTVEEVHPTYAAQTESGYPSINKVTSNKFFFVSADLKSTSDVDTVGGYYSIALDLFTEYKYRIKLTTDNTKIDTANLTWFPVTVFLTGSQGEEVFARFDADTDYSKSAFTKSDGVTLLYSEMELFDDSESKGTFHTSRNAWVLAHDASTDFYYYFDDDGVENTNYMGTIGAVNATKVWNDEYEFVCHGVDDTTSTVLDSTSSNNDGTKKAANEPIEATGKVGQAQDFDGDDDYISIADDATIDFTGDFTVETLSLPTDNDETTVTLAKRGTNAAIGAAVDYGYGMLLIRQGAGVFWPHFLIDDTTYYGKSIEVDIVDTNYHYIAGRRNGSTIYIWLDDGTNTESLVASNNTIENDGALILGRHYDASYFSTDTIDEARVSGTSRADEWLKATYNSLLDSLLTYGSEETEGVTTNVMFMFSDF